MCSTLKDGYIMSRTFTIRKRAHRLRRFVFETGEEFVELVDAERFEEPFAYSEQSASFQNRFEVGDDLMGSSGIIHIRPR